MFFIADLKHVFVSYDACITNATPTAPKLTRFPISNYYHSKFFHFQQYKKHKMYQEMLKSAGWLIY